MDYDLFQDIIESLCSEIVHSSVEYDAIVAPARGGLIPGVVLSHRLQLPLFPITWATRDHTEATVNGLSEELLEYLRAKSRRLLLVEDIVDTGKTARQILNSVSLHQQMDVVAIVVNTSQPVNVKYKGMLIDRKNDDRWVDFWWEKKCTVTK